MIAFTPVVIIYILYIGSIWVLNQSFICKMENRSHFPMNTLEYFVFFCVYEMIHNMWNSLLIARSTRQPCWRITMRRVHQSFTLGYQGQISSNQVILQCHLRFPSLMGRLSQGGSRAFQGQSSSHHGDYGILWKNSLLWKNSIESNSVEELKIDSQNGNSSQTVLGFAAMQRSHFHIDSS